MGRAQRVGLFGAACALVVASAFMGVNPAGAAPGPEYMTCTASATVTTIPAALGVYSWTVKGTGSCLDPNAVQSVTLDGSGTSHGLGACTPNGSGLVDNLDITTTLTLTSTATGVVRAVLLHFGAPETTYPITTPFAVTKGGSTVGAGTLFTHIFGQCPPIGTSSSSVDWVQTV